MDFVDTFYIEARDKLIPFAERFATDESKKQKLPKKEREAYWNKCFHRKMNELARVRLFHKRMAK